MTSEAKSSIDNDRISRSKNCGSEQIDAAIAHYRYMLHLLPHFFGHADKKCERSSLVTAGRRIFFSSDAGEGTSLPA
jgi:hypothetical protein